ncbi:unnamed protein product [Nezara viridula]|uniref:Uncharacterized protein n=1 Tax=Nezara viridula TaxID=85310 RepID=A0A9P0MQL1_NEZVI|nr:unnamed protein product [Nezara viridula]
MPPLTDQDRSSTGRGQNVSHPERLHLLRNPRFPGQADVFWTAARADGRGMGISCALGNISLFRGFPVSEWKEMEGIFESKMRSHKQLSLKLEDVRNYPMVRQTAKDRTPEDRRNRRREQVMLVQMKAFSGTAVSYLMINPPRGCSVPINTRRLLGLSIGSGSRCKFLW